MYWHRFNTVLDSKKTGLLVRSNILTEDSRRFGHKQPECLRLAEEEWPDQESLGQGNGCPKRSSGLPPFILDELLKEGKQLENHYLQLFEGTTSYPRRRPQDAELSKPWSDAQSRSREIAARGCEVLTKELEMIEKHVTLHVTQWQRACGNSRSSADLTPPSPHKTRSSRRDDTPPEPRRNQAFKDVSRSFADGPKGLIFYDDGMVAMLRASCAYRVNPKFAFSVAFYELCKIKSTSAGALPYVREFGDMLAMPSSARRILMQKASGL